MLSLLTCFNDVRFEIQGPVIHDVFCSSMEVVKRLMLREMPILPNIVLSGCHVTDVAEAHLAAMLIPEAAEKRHIIVSSLESDSFKVSNPSPSPVPKVILKLGAISATGLCDLFERRVQIERLLGTTESGARLHAPLVRLV